MRSWHKLVSIGVLAIIVMVPFVSFAMCVPESTAPTHCPPDCPMMAKTNSGQRAAEIQSQKSRPCCEISSSKPAPVTESKTVAPVVSIEPVVVTAPLVVATNIGRTETINTSPPLRIDSQAQLCTFLI